MHRHFAPVTQGCSLGLERLGLDSRDIFWNVLVLKVERLGLISFSRVWKNQLSRSWRYKVSGFVHQTCGCIRKKIMDLTRKKQVVKWQTLLVSVFKLRHCGLETFYGTYQSQSWKLNVSSRSCGFSVSVSSRSWAFVNWNISVLKVDHLSLVT